MILKLSPGFQKAEQGPTAAGANPERAVRGILRCVLGVGSPVCCVHCSPGVAVLSPE